MPQNTPQTMDFFTAAIGTRITAVLPNNGGSYRPTVANAGVAAQLFDLQKEGYYFYSPVKTGANVSNSSKSVTDSAQAVNSWVSSPYYFK